MGIQELFTELKKIAVTPRYSKWRNRDVFREFPEMYEKFQDLGGLKLGL